MDARISRFLNDALKLGWYSADELARAAACHPSHIRKVAGQETMLSAEKTIRLAHWMLEAGDPRFAEIWCTEDWEVTRRQEGRADGRIDDDVLDLDEAEGAFIRAMREADYEKAAEAVKEISREVGDLRAELDRSIANGHAA